MHPVSREHSLLYQGMTPVAVILFSMDEPIKNYSILSWNVRGLNSAAKQEDVKQVIQTYRPMLVCLQETKMQDVTSAVVRNSVGNEYADNYQYLPANNTRGGIIVAFRDQHIQLSGIHNTANIITATVTDNRSQDQWTLSVVYGPQSDQEKIEFLREMRQLKHTAKPAWLILGD